MNPGKRRPFRVRLIPSSVGQEEHWLEWFKGTYALVWYLVGVLAVCLFTLVELKDRSGWPYTGVVAVALIICLGALGLRFLWPEDDELDIED